jgi:CheY-like chemotaxis protein
MARLLADEDFPHSVTHQLQALGHDVRTALEEGLANLRGGDEALRRARELHPDVITLDVAMPGRDCWAVLGELKTDPELREIPVVMVTMLQEKGLACALDASDFLTKPVSRDRLAAVLDRYRQDAGEPAVLVVDDDAETREMLQRTLERAGWRVTAAEDGSATLRRAAEQPPGLILLDLMMPGMDGFQCLEELRKLDATRDVPVLILTAKDLTPEDRRRLDGAVQRILQKGSYAGDELLREIRRHLPHPEATTVRGGGGRFGSPA